MASNFVMDIVTPEKSVLTNEEVYVVVIPAGTGYLSAMTGHIPLLTILKPGIVEFLGKKRSSHFFVSGGFVEVLPEKVTVIAEKVETIEEMDVEKVKSLKKDVEEKLKSASSSDKDVFIEYEEATSKLYLLEKHHLVL